MIRKLRLWQAVILAILSGLSLQASFPSPGWWPLAFVSLYLLAWALLGRSFWAALLVGLITGAAFWLVLIRWLTLYLGPVPWLALGLLQTAFFAMGVVGFWFVLNRGGARWKGTWFSLVIVPSVVGALWASRELVTSNWPYGGFSWGLIAQSQSSSPFTPIVAWLGTYGLSALVVFVSVAVFQLSRQRPTKRLVAAPALVLLALVLVPLPPSQEMGYLSVLAVQGNSKAGLFDDRTSGDILNDHVVGTLPFTGRPIDVVVWPENAADIDPLSNAQAAKVLDAVAESVGAPIVTGAITQNSQGQYFNSSLVWQPGVGVTAQFDKLHPVPFAEYMPDRSLWRTFAPELVDLVSYDYTPGVRPNVVDVGNTPVGLAICFDITYEQQARQFVSDGAQIVFAQTNNADFGRTDESVQQLAITRLRAVETGRAIVNISTVGVSAIILPNGATLSELDAYQPGAMLENVPLSTSITPAMAWGQTIEMLLLLVTFVGLLLLCVRSRKP